MEFATVIFGCAILALPIIALVLIVILLVSEPKSPPVPSGVSVEIPHKEREMATHQAFVPITRIPPALLPKTLNYRPEYEGEVFVGLGKPGKDSYRYGFVCDVDEEGGVVKARYDGLKKFDGPVGPNGHATPGAVMVVAEKREDGYYLYVSPEFRVFIYDDEKVDVAGNVTANSIARWSGLMLSERWRASVCMRCACGSLPSAGPSASRGWVHLR